MKDMTTYEPIPLEKITVENLADEMLNCMASAVALMDEKIGVRRQADLLNRLSLLHYWKTNGINYDDIKTFEKDPFAFLSL